MATRRPFWKWRRWKSIGFCLWPQSTCIWSLKLKFRKLTWLTLWKPCHLQSPETKKSNMAPQAAILKMLLLKINRLLPIYIRIVLLKFEVDIQSQSKDRVLKPKNPIWQPGFCLWPPSTCIWNLKLKFQSKLELCSGNHVIYRQTDGRTDGRTDKVNPVYTPSNSVGRGYKNTKSILPTQSAHIFTPQQTREYFFLIP